MAEITPLPPTGRFALRGDAAALHAGCAEFGVPMPGVLRAATAPGRSALWLGPDEVLLLGPLGGDPPQSGWTVDVSERQVGFAVAGAGAARLLASGSPLDLERFPVGACTRTLLGKADIVLWHTAADAWRVEVWRSFAAYARALLEQAAKDWP